MECLDHVCLRADFLRLSAAFCSLQQLQLKAFVFRIHMIFLETLAYFRALFSLYVIECACSAV